MYFASERKSNLNLNKKVNKPEGNLYNPNDESWSKLGQLLRKL